MFEAAKFHRAVFSFDSIEDMIEAITKSHLKCNEREIGFECYSPKGDMNYAITVFHSYNENEESGEMENDFYIEMIGHRTKDPYVECIVFDYFINEDDPDYTRIGKVLEDITDLAHEKVERKDVRWFEEKKVPFRRVL